MKTVGHSSDEISGSWLYNSLQNSADLTLVVLKTITKPITQMISLFCRAALTERDKLMSSAFSGTQGF